jgi:hypothetical protein
MLIFASSGSFLDSLYTHITRMRSWPSTERSILQMGATTVRSNPMANWSPAGMLLHSITMPYARTIPVARR